MKIYCVYLHVKLSDGKPFYVGKGKIKRAHTHAGRSIHWHRIVSKHGLSVRIIKSDMSEPCSFSLERALITGIGRGNLCNQTDGGEGTSGRIVSAAHRAKCSKSNKGTKPAPHSIALARTKNSKPIGTRCGLRFSSATDAAKAIRSDIWQAAKINICGCASGKTKHAYGLEWGYLREGKPEFLYVPPDLVASRSGRWASVKASNGMVFNNAGRAAEWLSRHGWPKASGAPIGLCCRGLRRKAYGMSWSYA